MRSTYSCMYIHLVWATADRRPTIDVDIEPRLHANLAAIAHRNLCTAVAVGGTHDHVHLLLGIVPRVAVSELVRELNACSSGFVHDHLGRHSFAWQGGYGVFTLGPRSVTTVTRYVRNQRAHHTLGTLRPALEIDGIEVPSPKGVGKNSSG